MGKLDNKIAVITGGIQPNSLAIAQAFAAENAKAVIILDAQPARELENGVRTVQCNIGDYEDVTRVFTALQETVGEVDILVNNPEMKCEKTLLETTPEEWNAVLAHNTHSLFYICKQIMPQLKARRTGKIINISSPQVYGVAGNAAYAITKAAMLGIHGTISRETERYTTTTHTIVPAGNTTPEEVAKSVVFMASEESRFVHGQIVNVTHSFAE